MNSALLSRDELRAAEDALLGPVSTELMQVVRALDFGWPPPPLSPARSEKVRSVAYDLGWAQRGDRGDELTPLGELVADPIREYLFWIERDRTLHSAHQHPGLRPETYRGKVVLEPGSGFGCNLFSLAKHGIDGAFIGLEPVALYLQLSPVFAEREGIAPPTVVQGVARAMPFEDASFDVVLCYSAHQYMELNEAIGEMARVLRPGGELRIIGGTLRPFTRHVVRRVLTTRSLRGLKHDALAVVNTLSYQALGRRLYVPGGVFATAAPIYTTRRFMREMLRSHGLDVDHRRSRRLGDETALFAIKRA